MENITNKEIKALAEKYGYEYASVKAVCMVEGAGRGFDGATGKILIQFEPAWYKKIDAQNGFSGGGIWESNKVEGQSAEWKAFNDAFSKDPDAAMQATSWGAMQVMGFHYKVLGFKTVGEMVDFAKKSESNQVELGLMFIKQHKQLDAAMKAKDFKEFAYYYNGKLYYVNKYDKKLSEAYAKAALSETI